MTGHCVFRGAAAGADIAPKIGLRNGVYGEYGEGESRRRRPKIRSSLDHSEALARNLEISSGAIPRGKKPSVRTVFEPNKEGGARCLLTAVYCLFTVSPARRGWTVT